MPVNMQRKQTIHSAEHPKVVILGASGRLGGLIRPFWQNMNTIWQSRSLQQGFKSLDILKDPDGLATLLSGSTAVMCLAGVTPSSTNGTLEQNALLAEACLNAAKVAKVGRVFLTSTAAVYGKQTNVLDERCPVQPLSDYARAKIAMEGVASRHDQVSTVLRIGNVAGADAILGNWYPEMEIEQLEDSTTPKRSYVGPATLSRILMELTMCQTLPPILNVAAPESIHMNELLDSAGLYYTKKLASDQTIAEVTLNTKLLQQYVAFTQKDSQPSTMVTEWKRAVSTR